MGRERAFTGGGSTRGDIQFNLEAARCTSTIGAGGWIEG